MGRQCCKGWRGRVGAFVLCAVLTAGAGRAMADDVRVLATGVFATSLRDLHAAFAASGGTGFQATIGNAGQVHAKLMAGAPADVVMTSSSGVDALVREGTLDAGSRVEIGRMRLGLAVRDGAPMPDATTRDRVRALFLAAPAVAYVDPRGGATAGAFAERVFDLLGIADAVHGKSVLCDDGAEVVAALTSGRATLGMTQASEILGAPGVAFAGFLPEPLNSVSTYAAAAVLRAQPSAAATFLRFMTSPPAVERLRRAGWDVTGR